MKPLDLRLISKAKATTGYLLLVVALAIMAMAATLGIAWSLASFVVAIFVEQQELEQAGGFLAWALLSAGIRAVIHFFSEWAGFWAAGRVKLELRSKALAVLDRGGSDLVAKHGSAQLSQLLGPSLDSLDVYFSKYLPQLVFTALVTPALTVLIWFMDAPSGWTVLFTLPLIPFFMALIGYVTKDLQDAQLDALERLNGHFLEVIKGLVTLKVFNRTVHQGAVLAEVSDQYRSRTMKVLRLSFLSGFALELAASLSVALIAVSIGLRLVEGEMALFTGLFILIIAPEVYLPLRNVGAQFHAAAQGVAVSSKVLDLIETKLSRSAVTTEFERRPGLTVLVGKSGSGKSLALKSMISDRSVWMPQLAVMMPGTIQENIVGPGEVNQNLLRKAMSFAQIQDLDAQQVISEQDGLSGGQRQRVSLARAIYFLQTSGRTTLLLDEPTSQLDQATAEGIVASLKQLAANGIEVIVASHSELLISEASQVVKIE
jgi:ATP-binding cassette subfamily C protein CydD